MSEAPYVNFYTSDFLGGTSGMTASTKGVYITLTCLMYEGETPLHQSWEMLARRCGASLPAFRKAIADLQSDGKVILKDGGLWSPKCDKHIALRSERRNSAKAAAEIRWEKSKQKQQALDATASFAQCQPEPEPEPEKLKREAKASLSVADQDDCFQHFNLVASQVGWSRVQSITKDRRAALAQRIKSVGGADHWREAINRAAASAFLTGNNPSGWRADFDWLSGPKNFTKLMEGNYDDRKSPGNQHQGNTRSGPHNALMAGFAMAAHNLKN